MNIYCHECGHALEKSASFCPECGSKVMLSHEECKSKEVNKELDLGQKIDSSQPAAKESRSNKEVKSNSKKTKKNNRIFIIVLLVILLLGGGLFYANHYYSKGKTAERFRTAIKDKNVDQLMQMMRVSGKKDITKSEIEAFLTFAKEERKMLNSIIRGMEDREGGFFGEIMELKETDKLLWIIPRYKVEVIGHYVHLNYPFKAIQTTFNGHEFKPLDENQDTVTFGPFMPGVYKMENVYKGEFADATDSRTIRLWDDVDSSYTFDIDLNLSEVEVFLDGVADTALINATLKIGDKEIAMDDDHYFETFGPVSTDGDVTFKIIAEYPWGTVESKDITVVSGDMEVSATFVDEKFIESISAPVSEFAESYLEALALRDHKKMKHSTENAKLQMKEEVDYLDDIEEYYTAKLNNIYFYTEYAPPFEDGVNIMIDLEVEESYYNAYYDMVEEPVLEEDTFSLYLTLIYNEEKKDWTVDYFNRSGYDDSFEEPIIYPGLKQQYLDDEKPKSKQDEKDNQAAEVTEETLENFMDTYNFYSVEAINLRDFEMVEDLIDTNGPRYQEQQDYLVNTIIPKEITEEYISTTLESFKQIDDETFEVVTIEEFIIIKPGEENRKKFRTTNIVKLLDNTLYLHELKSTKSIE